MIKTEDWNLDNAINWLKELKLLVFLVKSPQIVDLNYNRNITDHNWKKKKKINRSCFKLSATAVACSL